MRTVSVSEVERLAAHAVDSRMLRAGLVDLLARQLPVVWSVFVLTDPRSTVGVDPVATVPDGVNLSSLVRGKYLTSAHRWTTLSRAASWHPDEGDSPLQQVMASHGVSDVLSCAFRDAYGTWGFLDLWSKGTFSDRDHELVDESAPIITAAMRRCQALALRPHRAATVVGSVVLVLDDDLEVSGSTSAAADWLARLLPPAGGAPPVPAVAWNVAAQLLAVEAGVDSHVPEGRVHLADGVWITVRAARLGAGRGIAVAMEPTSGADRADLVVRAYGMTDRERAVLSEVCAGRSNTEVAARLHLSPLTVQDHLKSMFARTAVHSRGALAALALGVSG